MRGRVQRLGSPRTVCTYWQDRQPVVEIGDTEAGIQAEVKSRIFEPFFTTEPVRRAPGSGWRSRGGSW